MEEEAWNAYPYTKTRYRVPFMEKFSLEIETRYLDDAGESENVFDMSSAELNTRIVGKIPSYSCSHLFMVSPMRFHF